MDNPTEKHVETLVGFISSRLGTPLQTSGFLLNRPVASLPDVVSNGSNLYNSFFENILYNIRFMEMSSPKGSRSSTVGKTS